MKNLTKYEVLTALCEAAEKGDIPAAQKAIEAGASVNGRVEYGKTPVMFAIGNAQVGMITFLKSRGARLNMLDEDFEHPMIYAFTNLGSDINDQAIPTERTTEVLRTLLLLGADPNARGEFGTPAFHYAAAMLDGKQLLELANLKLEVGTIDQFGKSTALHALAHNKTLTPPQADLLIALVESDGIDIEHKNSDGQSALFVATQRKNEVFVSSLVAAGAKKLTPAMMSRIKVLQEGEQDLEDQRKTAFRI